MIQSESTRLLISQNFVLFLNNASIQKKNRTNLLRNFLRKFKCNSSERLCFKF